MKNITRKWKNTENVLLPNLLIIYDYMQKYLFRFKKIFILCGKVPVR